jgi:hypothetical protein
MQARAFLNLVRFGATLAGVLYFHRLRSCKFSMGASAGWQRASGGRAGWQLRARKRRAGSVLKPKPSTGERCLCPWPLSSSLSRPHQPCYPGCWRIAHHRQPYDPGPVGAPSLNLTRRRVCRYLRPCVLRAYALPHASTSCEESLSSRVGSRPKALATKEPGRRRHCAACPPAHGMGAKRQKRTSRRMRNHMQTNANVSLSWVNCALTGSHQIITLAQRPPAIGCSLLRRCACATSRRPGTPRLVSVP